MEDRNEDAMFGWLRKNSDKEVKGKIVDLKLNYYRMTILTKETESVIYQIYLHNSSTLVGECDLRLPQTEEFYYAGNVGYRIYEPYRGHGYAYEACKLLFSIAKNQYQMQELIITCSPDNIASNKTCQKLGGEFVETTPVPITHWLYLRGETIKNIYRYKL